MEGGTAGAFRLDLDAVDFVGHDLQRPECVLATRSGDLYCSDKRGGVVHIAPDGSQRLIGEDPRIIANGIALRRDGSFLVANLSDEGGVWSLDRSGRFEPFLLEVEGRRLPSVNFVWLDYQDRLWVCVATPRAGDHQFRPDLADGYIVLVDDKGARIVAEDVHWTNECRLDPAGRWLYQNETFGRRLLRFPVETDGSLGKREIVAEFGAGMFPDGLAQDAEGGIWVIGVATNSIVRVLPDGRQEQIAFDCDARHAASIEAAFAAKELGRPLLYQVHSRVLPNVTSLAFGGADLKTAYMGSVAGSSLARFRSPVAGLQPPYWDFGPF